MFKKLDDFLDSMTMYRLVLFVLLAMAGYSLLLSGFGKTSFTPLEGLTSIFTLFAVCGLSNNLLARVFKAPLNMESSWITSLILYLIVDPKTSSTEILFLVFAGLLAMASKYVFCWKQKHFFNPVAISLFILGLVGFGGGTWWIASREMLPVALLGLLIVKKVRKNELFFSFMLFSLGTILFSGFGSFANLLRLFVETLTSWPLIFFAGIMLTEPLTSPNRKRNQVVFGALVGILFGSRFEFGPVYSTPEFALIVGNIFAFFTTSHSKQWLKLRKIEKLSPTIFEFVFEPSKKFDYFPGQYAELTLPHLMPDNRGNRRYFTIASCHTENDIRFGLRIEKNRSSSFKVALQNLSQNSMVQLTQVGGDFILPTKKDTKLIFIAGGVGITPFVSMVRHLLKIKEKREITLFYLVKSLDDFVYREVFEKAEKELFLKLVLIVSDTGARFTSEIFKKEVPDYKDRVVYVSGSNSMVIGCKETLKVTGVNAKQIKTDYFSGY